ncbi:MAG: FAD-dependent oxidoreductase [Gammaproteobacteria bacterium]|nr:FAD-dependent oxidoreductase [Gammaproteobacteria bacterium]
MSAKIEHVVIIGGGIGGLMSALALNEHGIKSTVFERDPTPPEGIDPADSMEWHRRGVPQALHPHFFMGRLRLLIEERYPVLAESLREAGTGQSAFSDYIHPTLADRVKPMAGDAQLFSFNSRRTTFEMTVRKFVGSLDNVTINDSIKVLRLLAENIAADQLAVRGVEVDSAEGPVAFTADAVIDASGRTSKLTRQLGELGAVFDEELVDSGIFYFTRHYKLNEGQIYPDICGLPGQQFNDFTIGALPADNGAFTVTFTISKEDEAGSKAIRDPDHFQRITLMSGRIGPWVDPERATPTSDVYGFGQMDSFWRRTVVNGKAGILNFFCVGDSGIRGNPKYGRGCTWSSIAAHLLADLIAEEMLPEARIAQYEALLEDEFREDWITMREIDLAAQRNFRICMGKEKATLLDRAKMYFGMLFLDALVTEPELFREVWREYHGLATIGVWQRSPVNWFRLARAILTRGSTNHIRISEQARPTHEELVAPVK